MQDVRSAGPRAPRGSARRRRSGPTSRGSSAPAWGRLAFIGKSVRGRWTVLLSSMFCDTWQSLGRAGTVTQGPRWGRSAIRASTSTTTRRARFATRGAARARPSARRAPRGNPSSLHAEGRAARAILERRARAGRRARRRHPRGGRVHERRLRGDRRGDPRRVRSRAGSTRRRIVVSAIEHSAVLEAARAGRAARVRRRRGARATREGRVDAERFATQLGDGRALAACSAANNETGVLQPVEEVGRGLPRSAGVPFLVDAVQAAGKMPLDRDGLAPTCSRSRRTSSAGPQGAGALVVRDGDRAGAARRRRSAGAKRRGGTARGGRRASPGSARRRAAALEALRRTRRAGCCACAAKLETRLSRRLRPASASTARRAAPAEHDQLRDPRRPGRDARDRARTSPASRVSTGSACASGAVEPSHVIRAMGFDDDARARGAVRLSLGWSTTAQEVDRFLERFPRWWSRSAAASPPVRRPSAAELTPVCASRRGRTVAGSRMHSGLTAVAMSGGVDSSVAAALLAREGRPLVGFSHAARRPSGRRDRALRPLLLARRLPRRARASPTASASRTTSSTWRTSSGATCSSRSPRTTRPDARRRPACAATRFVKFGALLGRARGRGRRARRDRSLRDPRARSAERPDAAAPRGRRGQGPVVLPVRPLRGAARARRVPARADDQGRGARAARASSGLATAEKPESMDLCFVARGRDATASSSRRSGLAGADAPGAIVDARRTGARASRRGLAGSPSASGADSGSPSSRPLYVMRVEAASRRVVVGDDADLDVATAASLERVRWIPFDRPAGPLRADVRIRSTARRRAGHDRAISATARARSVSTTPQRALDPRPGRRGLRRRSRPRRRLDRGVRSRIFGSERPRHRTREATRFRKRNPRAALAGCVGGPDPEIRDLTPPRRNAMRKASLMDPSDTFVDRHIGPREGDLARHAAHARPGIARRADRRGRAGGHPPRATARSRPARAASAS